MKYVDQMRPDTINTNIQVQREKDAINFYDKYHKNFVDIKCPACDKSGANVYFVKWGFEHKLCVKCLTIFCSPRPREEHLSLFYEHYLTPKMWTQLLLKTDVKRKVLQYQPRIDYILSVLRGKQKTGGGG